MADERDGGVPAGWYPDPLGLPQLRWWDNHSWTEHVAEARQPMVVQEQQPERPAAYADDDLPSRREMREREREQRGDRPVADGLRELAPPDRRDADEPRDGVVLSEPARERAGAAPAERVDTTADDGPDDRSSAAAEPSPAVVAAPDAASDGVTPVTAPTSRPSIHTAPVWIITLLPLLQVLCGLLLVTALPAGRYSWAALAIGAVPYAAGVVLAALDARLLRRQGVERPASWLWAFLTAPVYLLARLVATARATGRGFSPVVVFAATVVLALLAIVAVPGLLISATPALYAGEAERAVSSQASIIGAQLDVDCPADPPVIVGQSFSCSATRVGDAGDPIAVTVSLQRANGWIAWRVDDWGVYTVN